MFTEIKPILSPGIVLSTFGVLLTALFTACDSKQPTSRKPTLTVTLEPLRYFTETGLQM